MPVALVAVLLDISLIYHASKTGRFRPWAFIILMAPLIGALAYIAVELVPEWLGGPAAQQARQRVANRLDPENTWPCAAVWLRPVTTGAWSAGAVTLRVVH